MLLNGPESFTLDGNFILGEAPELRNYFVCAGFNSAGIANAGGAGRLIAEWIVGGEAPHRPVGRGHPPLRAASPPTARRCASAPSRRWACTTRCAGRAQELETARPLRTSPLYDRLAGEGRGVRQQERLGARQLLPARRRRAPAHTLDTPGWLPWMLDEQRARARPWRCSTRRSFSKLLLKGRDALAVLQRLCANEMDVPVGSMVYTAMLNARGGFESDLTVMRQARDAFLIVTGSAQATRDLDWIEPPHRRRRTCGAGRCHRRMFSVLSVMGPKARELLARVSPDDLSPAGAEVLLDTRRSTWAMRACAPRA